MLLCISQFTHRLPFWKSQSWNPVACVMQRKYEAGSVFTQGKCLLFQFTFLWKGWYQCSWHAHGRQWISSNWNSATRAEYFFGSRLPTCDSDAHRTHDVSCRITCSDTVSASSQGSATVGTTKASLHPQVPHVSQYQKLTKRSKQDKVHPCTGTEALYRLYGPQGE